MNEITPPNSSENYIAAMREQFELGVREGWRQSAAHLVCSWCGETQEGDLDGASDCCSCDLVPSHELPGILKQLREENEAMETKIGEAEDALAG